MKKNLFVLVLAVAMSCSLSAFSKVERTTYFTTSEMADLLKCLPAPPDTTSEAFAHDIMRYMWGKTQRADKERAAMVARDAVWSFEALFAEMSVPFGFEITEAGTPEIFNVLVRAISTIDQMRVQPKAYYMRKRPFVRFKEHMLTEWEEAELAGEGSYPSGHASRGWSAALLLSEINPSAVNELSARGLQYGESRVITGAHWQSDVDAAQQGASIGFALLHSSPEFLRDMAKAREELKRLTKSKK